MRRILLSVGMLYLHKQELIAQGKKLASSDEAMLREAEKLTENEFAFVLGLNADEVGSYIRARLGLE